MARTVRALTIGVALALLLVGCQGGKEANGRPTSSSPPATRLTDLETIDVDGDPLAEVPGSIKMLSDLHYGRNRILTYANNESCGILAHAIGDPKVNRIHLVSRWPNERQGSNSYPAGPYNTVSGASGPKIWASLMCSKNAMVIEYVSGEPSAPATTRGPISTTQISNHPVTTQIIVGEAGLRKQIKDHHASLPGISATSPAR
ncbi:hypothetical protein ACIQUV_12250 [Streptomyces globosus]|uniref:hypothetical protein n=2 Tax=Streptomyces TaxID=1883 RepID=UPI00381499B5